MQLKKLLCMVSMLIKSSGLNAMIALEISAPGTDNENKKLLAESREEAIARLYNQYTSDFFINQDPRKRRGYTEVCEIGCFYAALKDVAVDDSILYLVEALSKKYGQKLQGKTHKNPVEIVLGLAFRENDPRRSECYAKTLKVLQVAGFSIPNNLLHRCAGNNQAIFAGALIDIGLCSVNAKVRGKTALFYASGVEVARILLGWRGDARIGPRCDIRSRSWFCCKRVEDVVPESVRNVIVAQEEYKT